MASSIGKYDFKRVDAAIRSVKAMGTGAQSVSDVCCALAGLNTGELEMVSTGTRQPMARLQRLAEAAPK